jgi:hypothetical protein
MSVLAQHENEEIILNATGGTKIMAFAAFEVFRERGKPILYVDTQDKRIDILSPERKKIEFRGVMKARAYLAAYGQYIISETTRSDIPKAHDAITGAIINDMGNHERGVGLLNKYAAPYRNARTFPLEIEISPEDLESGEFQSITSLFATHNMLVLNEKSITFPSLPSVEFASGGWLEEHVFNVVSSLPVTDLRMGVKVKWDEQGPKPPTNEYDVLFTHHDQLYLIECKTKRFEGTDRGAGNEDPIYKLESLKDTAGGLYGKGMLVSYKRLTDVQKKRLKAYRLEYCDNTDLKNLKERIRQWIK